MQDTTLGHVRNLAGMQSGTLIVQRYIKTRRQGADEALQMAIWACRCTACDAVVRRSRRDIVAGEARCSCQRKIRKDLTGQGFGRLTVTGPSEKRLRDGESWWHVQCACGNVRELRRSSLVKGDTRSCGCLRRETTAENQAMQA